MVGFLLMNSKIMNKFNNLLNSPQNSIKMPDFFLEVSNNFKNKDFNVSNFTKNFESSEFFRILKQIKIIKT